MAYDPTIGKWLQEDPDEFGPGDANLYRYVENDPTNLTDPSGLSPWGDANLYMERWQRALRSQPKDLPRWLAESQATIQLYKEDQERRGDTAMILRAAMANQHRFPNISLTIYENILIVAASSEVGYDLTKLPLTDLKKLMAMAVRAGVKDLTATAYVNTMLPITPLWPGRQTEQPAQFDGDAEAKKVAAWVTAAGAGIWAAMASAPSGAVTIAESRAAKIFRDVEGHLPDTPANRQLLTDVANDPAAKLGPDRWGNIWNARTNADGSQVWVQIRNNQVVNGGLNSTARAYNPITGLSALTPP